MLLVRGIAAEDVEVADDARELLVAAADGDGRALLGGLEVAAALARAA